ncbi:MAG: hypothetical protein C9356_02750 [Oleiphilus sp.]|nr:MAG: hypothetical protein C9356_02750 [Oleiphilus sp.]
MIQLKGTNLVLRFPQVHPKAKASIEFMRTLRVPNDGNTYPLPAGLGSFELEHIEDHKAQLPEDWLKRGGVMLPMFQSEAMWISFNGTYPIALKVATGKINAITGELWTNELTDEPQNYVVLSEQPWLDGYAVEQGTVRQFVATPLGSGESAEEQITGEAAFGGIQIQAFPMKREVYKELFESPKLTDEVQQYLEIPAFLRRCSEPAMGLVPGGSIAQEIHKDEYGLDAWDLSAGSRCFIHTVNSEAWSELTDLPMPHKPISARDYKSANIPWFKYYAQDKKALPGSAILQKLKSKKEKPATKREDAEIGQNMSDLPVVKLRRSDVVTEGVF